MKAPFQVLVVPYRRSREVLDMLVLQRRYGGAWQFVPGGGHVGEAPAESACRELAEETGVRLPVVPSDTVSSVPAVAAAGELAWGIEHLVLRERSFAADFGDGELGVRGRARSTHHRVMV